MNKKYFFILTYTFSQDCVSRDFVNELKSKFKLEWLDQSTYALITNPSLSGVINQLSSIVNNMKSKGWGFDQDDFVNLYYSEGLTDHNDSKKDKIIRWNIRLK